MQLERNRKRPSRGENNLGGDAVDERPQGIMFRTRKRHVRLMRLLLMLLPLLQLAVILLAFLLLRPRNSKAIPYTHIRLRLRHKSIANMLLVAAHPIIEALVAERVEWPVKRTAEELCDLGTGIAHNVVDICLEFLAELVERKVVHVFAEGVFDFAADSGDAEDDVGGEDAAGDGDPAELVPELEGQHHDVDPGDLGDGDGVGDGERGVEDAIDADEDVVEGYDGGDCCFG